MTENPLTRGPLALPFVPLPALLQILPRKSLRHPYKPQEPGGSLGIKYAKINSFSATSVGSHQAQAGACECDRADHRRLCSLALASLVSCGCYNHSHSIRSKNEGILVRN